LSQSANYTACSYNDLSRLAMPYESQRIVATYVKRMNHSRGRGLEALYLSYWLCLAPKLMTIFTCKWPLRATNSSMTSCQTMSNLKVGFVGSSSSFYDLEMIS